MKIFILANGEGTRWGNYLGVPKQLIEIDGETLIHRMVRLCLETGFKDIVIIGPYKVEGATNYIPEGERTEIGKYEAMRPLVDGPFAILYGDCYYTDAIIKDLYNRKTDKEHLHWSCQRGNKVTGKIWVEGYIHGVYDTKFWFDKVDTYKEMMSNGHKHEKDWQFFRHLIGTDINKHEPWLYKDYEVDWEDATDDFDFTQDYHNWMKNVKGIEVPKWEPNYQ